MQQNELERRFPHHRLRIHLPNGDERQVGRGGPVLDWHIHRHRALRRLLNGSTRRLGESYVAGDWSTAPEQLPLLIGRLLSPRPRRVPHGWLRRLGEQLFPRPRSERILSWQDDSLQLSRHCLGEALYTHCALFTEAGMSLEQAQRLARRQVLEQLMLQPGQHLLVVDAGWGALPLYLAREADVRITATCRSRAQLQHNRAAARRQGLDGRLDFRCGRPQPCLNGYDRLLLGDLRDAIGQRGFRHRLVYLSTLLRPGGLALLTTTGIDEAFLAGNRWLRRRLHGDGHGMRLSRLAAAAESAGLTILGTRNLAPHYRQSLAHWRRRLHYHRDAVIRSQGEKRVRGWEFELASLEAALADGGMHVWEMLVANGPAVEQPPRGEPGHTATGHDPGVPSRCWANDAPSIRNP